MEPMAFLVEKLPESLTLSPDLTSTQIDSDVPTALSKRLSTKGVELWGIQRTHRPFKFTTRQSYEVHRTATYIGSFFSAFQHSFPKLHHWSCCLQDDSPTANLFFGGFRTLFRSLSSHVQQQFTSSCLLLASTKLLQIHRCDMKMSAPFIDDCKLRFKTSPQICRRFPIELPTVSGFPGHEGCGVLQKEGRTRYRRWTKKSRGLKLFDTNV